MGHRLRLCCGNGLPGPTYGTRSNGASAYRKSWSFTPLRRAAFLSITAMRSLVLLVVSQDSSHSAST